jgi:hypothetical protein
VIDEKDNDSADERDKDAPNIEPGYTVPANGASRPTIRKIGVT